MSAETIELKIDSAKKKSEKMYKSEYSWQEEVDDLLDRMNQLNKLLCDLHALLLTISFELERDAEGFKKSEKAPAGIKALTTIISKILISVRKSNLYPGVKTTYNTIKTENNYLKELLHDRNVSLDLEGDEEMQQIISETILAAKK
ncbi:MAG: hypothetical protein QM534_09095 [Sediminibacterium sp.]|nr:hypothetical protein [Sediminibacterium sp.]